MTIAAVTLAAVEQQFQLPKYIMGFYLGGCGVVIFGVGVRIAYLNFMRIYAADDLEQNSLQRKIRNTAIAGLLMFALGLFVAWFLHIFGQPTGEIPGIKLETPVYRDNPKHTGDQE